MAPNHAQAVTATSTSPTSVAQHRASVKTMRPRTAVVATLGGKPQVITFAIDCLLRDFPTLNVQWVFGLCFASQADSDLHKGVHLLRREFAQYSAYAERAIRFDEVPVRTRPAVSLQINGVTLSGDAITDSDDPAAPDAIWMTTNRLIDSLHEEGYRIVLLVTGGPRLIALQAISAAALLLASHDKCYHLFTPPDLREAAGRGEILHSDDPHLQLVEVPLLPMGRIAPGLQAAASASPQEVIGIARTTLDAQALARCDLLLRDLAPRERDVLRAFATGDAGTTVDDVAQQLNLKPSTVNDYKTHIFDAYRSIWGLDEKARLTHHVLRESLGGLDAAFWRRWTETT